MKTRKILDTEGMSDLSSETLDQLWDWASADNGPLTIFYGGSSIMLQVPHPNIERGLSHAIPDDLRKLFLAARLADADFILLEAQNDG